MTPQSSQYKKYLLPVLLLSLAAGVYWAATRDYYNLKDGYACDLRKRIVGARYQALGYSPYFFKWQPGYPEALANPYEVGSGLSQNATTLPPSYLWLLQPLAKLSFPAISKIWLALQYVLLLGMVLFMIKLARQWQQRIWMIGITLAFLYSAGWITNADIGQSYLIFPFIWMCGYALGQYTQKPWLWAAIALALSCWLRPVCCLMVLPFLLMPQRKMFLRAFIPAALILALQALLTGQLHNWVEFFKSSVLWGQYYNNWTPAAYNQVGNPALPATIEGQTNFSITPLPDYLANLPMVIQNLTGGKLMGAIGFTVVMLAGMALLLWQVWKRRQQLSIEKIWLAGFLLYYLLELMATIPKPAYYVVELFFPVYLLAISWPQVNKVSRITLLFGLLLSILPSGIIPMNLLLGEYLMALALLLYWVRIQKLTV